MLLIFLRKISQSLHTHTHTCNLLSQTIFTADCSNFQTWPMLGLLKCSRTSPCPAFQSVPLLQRPFWRCRKWAPPLSPDSPSDPPHCAVRCNNCHVQSSHTATIIMICSLPMKSRNNLVREAVDTFCNTHQLCICGH